jgi:hypothetical protein
VSEETKMEIDHDCYNFSSEDDFSEDDDYMDKNAITIHRKCNK